VENNAGIIDGTGRGVHVHIAAGLNFMRLTLIVWSCMRKSWAGGVAQVVEHMKAQSPEFKP
jgi:hypothetical protein